MTIKFKILDLLARSTMKSSEIATALRSTSVPTYLVSLKHDKLVTVVGNAERFKSRRIPLMYRITAKGKRALANAVCVKGA